MKNSMEMNEMKTKIIDIIEKIVYHFDRVIVDNDFEHAYNMPFEDFKDYSKEDLIEALFVQLAIRYENETT